MYGALVRVGRVTVTPNTAVPTFDGFDAFEGLDGFGGSERRRVAEDDCGWWAALDRRQPCARASGSSGSSGAARSSPSASSIERRSASSLSRVRW